MLTDEYWKLQIKRHERLAAFLNLNFTNFITLLIFRFLYSFTDLFSLFPLFFSEFWSQSVLISILLSFHSFPFIFTDLILFFVRNNLSCPLFIASFIFFMIYFITIFFIFLFQLFLLIVSKQFLYTIRFCLLKKRLQEHLHIQELLSQVTNISLIKVYTIKSASSDNSPSTFKCQLEPMV